MMRKIKWWLIAGIATGLMIGFGLITFSRYKQPAVRTLPAKIEEIRQAVQLSTLDVTTEEIIRDTVHMKGVVYRAKARIHIRFDMEELPVMEQGDTLVVQLPAETIDVYEPPTGGFQVLDVWFLQAPDEPAETSLTDTEENLIKRKLTQRIKDQMYEKGYVKRARENAVRSLAILFSRFRDHVVIVDHYPDGWKHDELQPVFPEMPPGH